MNAPHVWKACLEKHTYYYQLIIPIEVCNAAILTYILSFNLLQTFYICSYVMGIFETFSQGYLNIHNKRNVPRKQKKKHSFTQWKSIAEDRNAEGFAKVTYILGRATAGHGRAKTSYLTGGGASYWRRAISPFLKNVNVRSI